MKTTKVKKTNPCGEKINVCECCNSVISSEYRFCPITGFKIIWEEENKGYWDNCKLDPLKIKTKNRLQVLESEIHSIINEL